MNLVYAGVVERGETTFGLFFPDLPGCVTVGDTMSELAHNAREALTLHLEGLLEDGAPIPEATPIDQLQTGDPEVRAAGVLMVESETAQPTVHVDVVLPSELLGEIDRLAQARGMTRSAFLAAGARELIAAE